MLQEGYSRWIQGAGTGQDFNPGTGSGVNPGTGSGVNPGTSQGPISGQDTGNSIQQDNWLATAASLDRIVTSSSGDAIRQSSPAPLIGSQLGQQM